MKKILRTIFVFFIFVLLFPKTQAIANPGDKLNVPGDFPNTFHMDLLGAKIVLDDPNAMFGGPLGFEFNLSTAKKSIAFTASAFDGVGTGSGTSDLSVSVDNYVIGSTVFFMRDFSLFINGQGYGTLKDNGDGTGEWSLFLPMRIEWLGGGYYGPLDLGLVELSTNTSYDYFMGFPPDPEDGGPPVHIETLSGQSINYHTGDAFIVGQTTPYQHPTAPNFLLNGVRFTLGINGNDPVIASVAEPASLLLLGSGLVCLLGLKRRR